MSLLNISTKTASPPGSLNSFTSRDSNDLTKPFVLIDKTNKQHIDLPLLHNFKMAHMLVEQPNHRTSSISIRRSTSSQKDSQLTMTHSVDERLFLSDSTKLLNLITRFASESQISKYSSQTTNFNGNLNKNPFNLTLKLPNISTSCSQTSEIDNEEMNFDDAFSSNCDNIQPVPITVTEDLNSDKIDNINLINNSLSEPLPITNDEVIRQSSIDEDIILGASPSIFNGETPCERHFRRRKRRSSLTKNSLSLDDTQSTVELIEKIQIDQQNKSEPSETSEKEIINETKPVENNQTQQEAIDDETAAPLSRYRGRRLRHRFYRHSASVTSPQEINSNVLNEHNFPSQALNVETNLNSASFPSSPSSPLSPSSPSSPLSPISPTLTTNSNQTSSTTKTGGLKRVHSTGTTKKIVHFADSVGLELTHVQYIRSSISDESKEFPLLLGSSLLSSSPPSFTKNNLYISNKLRVEHKPWAFDITGTPNKQINQVKVPRRFFCLFRQPNSEHPDIYLHEIWKCQIKLEHVDVPLKYSAAGFQQIFGTLWVTNPSYWKYVSVKYTFNQWLNTCEREAQHLHHSNDFRNIDRFQFIIDLPSDVDRVDFVLRYCVNGQEYWDNNDGKNYVLQTESAYTPSTTISLPHDCDFNEMRFY